MVTPPGDPLWTLLWNLWPEILSFPGHNESPVTSHQVILGPLVSQFSWYHGLQEALKFKQLAELHAEPAFEEAPDLDPVAEQEADPWIDTV